LGDQFKYNETGWAHGSRGVEEVYTDVWWGNLQGRDHFEDLGGDGRVT